MINDWPIIKLGEICDFYNGKAHEDCVNSNGKYTIVNSKFIASDGKEFKKTDENRFPLKINDIVMVMSDVPNGKALAKCFIIDKDNQYTLNQRICVLRSNKFDVNFLYYQLNRHNYLLSFDNGNRQTNLRKDDILKCPLLVPPIDEQKRIANKIKKLFEEIDKAIEKTNQQIKNTNNFFKSTLYSYFSLIEKEEQKVFKLKEIATFQNGYAFSSRDFNDTEGYLVIKMGNITKDGMLETNRNHKYISKEKGHKLQNFILQKGDIVITMTDVSRERRLIGHTAIIDKDDYYILNQRVGKIVPVNKFATVGYVHFFTNSPIFINYIKSNSSGVLQFNTSTKAILDAQVPIPMRNGMPDLNKQREIENKIKELQTTSDLLRVKCEKQLSILVGMKQSILNQAFEGKL